MKKVKKAALLLYLLIPVLSVCICRLLRLAQGEANEEIVFGVMLGLVLDAILGIVLRFF